SPSTPRPNKAKSYFTGSLASSRLRFSVSSTAVFQLTFSERINPRRRATRSTCTSHGQTRSLGLILLHIPKSTPIPSLRTIHLRNMFRRLQAEFCSGELMCFRVRIGKSVREKKYDLKAFRLFSIINSAPADCDSRNASSSELKWV